MKRYAEIPSPWQAPLSKLKYWLVPPVHVFLKTLLSLLYLANFTIIGQTLLFLRAPNLCVRLRSSSLVYSPIFSFKLSITIWSVLLFSFSGFPWMNKQFPHWIFFFFFFFVLHFLHNFFFLYFFLFVLLGY